MIQLQLINKILTTRDMSVLDNNGITADYFIGFEEEIHYIFDHYRLYGNVPDTATFLNRFPEFDLLDVEESDEYLVDTIQEEYLYYKAVPVVQKAAELLQTDANAASEYMVNALKDLKPNYRIGGTDIIAQAETRFEEYRDRKIHTEEWFFPSGFPELDELINGIQRKEELLVILARTNEGKSWVLEKMCTHVWQLGHNVGFISPEMGAVSVGFRFDTLIRNFSNKGLACGRPTVSEEEYRQYITDLKQSKNRFMVATPQDFNREITVAKLKRWVQQYDLELIAIDGITYLSDERSKRNDNKTTCLTNISEDLMLMSVELGIPVLIVVQSNRSGVNQDDARATPELDSVRDSDGIAHNATKVISIRQRKQEKILMMEVKKHRGGTVGGKLQYQWEIDKGDFKFLPSIEDAQSMEDTDKQLNRVRHAYMDKEAVF